MFGVNRDILLGKKLHNIGVGKSVHHIGNVSPALVLVCSSGARLQEVIAEAPGTGVNQLIDITFERTSLSHFEVYGFRDCHTPCGHTKP